MTDVYEALRKAVQWDFEGIACNCVAEMVEEEKLTEQEAIEFLERAGYGVRESIRDFLSWYLENDWLDEKGVPPETMEVAPGVKVVFGGAYRELAQEVYQKELDKQKKAEDC